MVWVPLITAAVISLGLLTALVWQRRQQRNGVQLYRIRFLTLVDQLDGLTVSVNRLGRIAQKVGEPKLLDYYEATLTLMEILLQAINEVAPYGRDPASLDSAFHLVKDTKKRLTRIQMGFADTLKGRPLKKNDLYDRPSSPLGCYFCSRPKIAQRFSKVRVRLDGKVREVASCEICKGELKQTKKVKVLYFMKDGQPVHWSDVSDYQPNQEYWLINHRTPIIRTRHLELIHSVPSEPLNSQ